MSVWGTQANLSTEGFDGSASSFFSSLDAGLASSAAAGSTAAGSEAAGVSAVVGSSSFDIFCVCLFDLKNFLSPVVLSEVRIEMV